MPSTKLWRPHLTPTPMNSTHHSVTATQVFFQTSQPQHRLFLSLEHTPQPPCNPHGQTAAAAKSSQSCLTLCNPIDGSLPGSAVPGISQARTLEWVAISFFNAWKWKVKVKSLNLVQLSNSMDFSLPGSSVHGIFQARVLRWVATAFSDGQTKSYLSFRPLSSQGSDPQ